ncbi:hypothetical protein RchiOBHm_Chr2g0125241 [Rosa chinensis]|uniref:Uncharacterized protein n=1 Tax=Rosa chinensis TaxID=74649 RepID=A0A2P6RTI3_ROSCH|nr:hypothetical protein RchiOBHm_Chr2g0125241 [Rosa chinensis]
MYNILANYTCSLYRLAARRKIQALLGRQPNSEYNQICFLFPYFFLFFIFFSIVFILGFVFVNVFYLCLLISLHAFN